MSILKIDRDLLDEVSREAAASPRQRKNRNFHPADDYPAHRLLNAIEPDSYIAPHRHLDQTKDETMVVLRGQLGLIIFDDAGRIIRTEVLEAGGELLGVDIPHGTWHTLVALASGTVFFEAKAGPYVALSEAERAPWAPAEGSSSAVVMLEIYRVRLARSVE
jgi:cupin fold WbuC family metalloprotein